MPKNTESGNVGDCRIAEEAFPDVQDIHERRNRRLRIDVRDLLFATRLGSRDESVAHDILSYLGRAEVLPKLKRSRTRKGEQHRHAHDAGCRSQRPGEREPAQYQEISQHFTFKNSCRPSMSQERLGDGRKRGPVRASRMLAPAVPDS